MSGYIRRPQWLRLSPFRPNSLAGMRELTSELKLHTVCENARCPNRVQCFAEGTATFMLLGDVCTRDCTFCAVKHGQPRPLDKQEPERIVAAVKKLGLRYVVLTSVTRDDLPDGGAGHFADTITAIHKYDPDIKVEVLVPDFKGSLSALKTVVGAAPAVLNHNVEAVPRLYPELRRRAQYRRSLELLRQGKILDSSILTKSGLMLGLGESRQEVIEVMTDLVEVGCDFMTIGQYLPPSLRHHDVVRYVPPDEFEEYADTGKKLGFRRALSGPLVRSSFQAAEMNCR